MSSSATPAGSTAPNPNLIALAKLLARIAVRDLRAGGTSVPHVAAGRQSA